MKKYTTDGKYEVKCGNIIVARSYVGDDGYEVRVRQGMPRMEVWEQIFMDCPEFAEANNMDRNKVPYLFAS